MSNQNTEPVDNSNRGVTGLTRVLQRYELGGANGLQFTEEGRLEAMRLFCVGYSTKGTVAAGCRAASVNRATVVYWLENYPVFQPMIEEAKEDYADRIRNEIDRRAVEGTVKEHRAYFKGELVDVYEEREFSDTLLMFQARARMPEYKDKAQETKDQPIPWDRVRQMLDDLPDQAAVNPGVPGTDVFYSDSDIDDVIDVEKYRWRDQDDRDDLPAE